MRNYNNHLSFIDLLMNALAVFAMLFIFTILQVNKVVKEQPPVSAPTDGQALIIMTWDDNSADDIDLWVKTPETMGNRIGYSNPSGFTANLERDDLGRINDQFKKNGKIGFINTNREVIKIRKLMDGTYIVNVEFYQRTQDPGTQYISHGPVKVKVQLLQFNPEYREVIQREFVLEDERVEKTAFTFKVENDEIVETNNLKQIPFIRVTEDTPGMR